MNDLQPLHDLADHGCRLHPCNKKVAIITGWPKSATDDHDQIDELFRPFPNAWPGIATGPGSGFVVLDVDDRDEFDGWCQETGNDPGSTVTVMTPSGGLHYYYATTDPDFRNWAKRIPGCDFRGDGGYVIAPVPWNDYSFALSFDDVDLAPMPEWLVTVCRAGKTKTTPFTMPTVMTKGAKHETLFKLGCSLRAKGLEEPEIKAALITALRSRQSPNDPDRVPDEHMAKMAADICGRYPAGSSAGFHCTDLGNSERFLFACRDRVRYCAPWSRWLIWDGRRWLIDDVQRVRSLAAEVARAIWREASEEQDPDRRKHLGKWASASESRQRIESMLSLASCSPSIAVRPSDLDTDPWVFNVTNGTLNLRTGQLREHDPDEMITKLAPVEYDPEATTTTWDAFLDFVVPDQEVQTFLQTFMGYSLSGDVGEQVLAFLIGPGANGKSTMLNALLHVFGDYGQQAPMDLLIAGHNDRHPTELADLQGARLVIATEVEEGRRWDEGRVKLLTGGEQITARRMRADFYSFPPTHKLFIGANHRPVVRGTDHAIWRRLRLVPFMVQIPNERRDTDLSEKLKAEASGVLTWCVRGCLQWQQEGLGEPDAVMNATAEYRSDMDVVGAFVADRLVLGCPESSFVSNREMRGEYEKWCETNGERPISTRLLSSRLQDIGLKRHRLKSTRGWNYVSLMTLDDAMTQKSGFAACKNVHENKPENAKDVSSSVTGRWERTTIPTAEESEEIMKLKAENPKMSYLDARAEVFGRGEN